MQKLVVVGNGMAGVACVEQILRHSPQFDITIFGDETHVNYNRILLSSVLAGEKADHDIVLNSLEWYERNHINLRLLPVYSRQGGRDVAANHDIFRARIRTLHR